MGLGRSVASRSAAGGRLPRSQGCPQGLGQHGPSWGLEDLFLAELPALINPACVPVSRSAGASPRSWRELSAPEQKAAAGRPQPSRLGLKAFLCQVKEPLCCCEDFPLLPLKPLTTTSRQLLMSSLDEAAEGAWKGLSLNPALTP